MPKVCWYSQGEVMSQQEWIASEFIAEAPVGFPPHTATGKLAGGQYQYEIALQDNGKWVLFPKKITFGPIYGATPQDCLDQLKAVGLE
jgi:hypothetical protein